MAFVRIPVLFLVISLSVWWYRTYSGSSLHRQDYPAEYDFIIIGAGTGGSAVVHKLITGLNASVLLIEAGEEMGIRSQVPFLCPFLQGTDSDWAFKTVPQAHSSYGFLNYQQKLPRGRGLGGSGQINYMMHSIGQPSDYDHWRDAFGLDNWSYANFSCYLDGVNCPDDVGGGGGSGGAEEDTEFYVTPLDIQESRLGLYLKRTEMEFRKDGVNSMRTKTAEFTTRHGKRWSGFNEFLEPIQNHPKLHILTNTVVSRIAIVGTEEKRAVGVYLTKNHGFIRARKEVILSAGTVQSPQLLLISGIGREKELKKLKIDHHLENEFVGENLFDHMNVPLYVTIDTPISVTREKILSISEVFKYLKSGQGIFASPGMIGTATRENSSAGVLLFGVGSIDESSLRMVSNLNFDAFSKIFPHYDNSSQEGFVLLSTCYHPKSRGSISLHSRTIFDHPQIDPQYYSEAYDIECAKDAIRVAMQLIESETFERLGARIVWPKLTECSNIDFSSQFDEYLECLIRTVAMTGHHPGGTCAMGKVVDQQLRLIGAKHLRVIDGSVFPAPISGYPNSVTRALARRAAQFIVDEYAEEFLSHLPGPEF